MKTEFKYKSLTAEQKLLALKLRFYDDMEWRPKAGDYYTTSRNDLELYKVVEIKMDYWVYTNYCDPAKTTEKPSKWLVPHFTKSEFGPRRVWVPNFILDPTVIDRWVDLDSMASEPKEKPEIESYDDLEADGNCVASEVEESAVRIDNTPKFTEATKYRMRQWSEDDRLRAIEYLQWLPDYHLKKLPIESTPVDENQILTMKKIIYNLQRIALADEEMVDSPNAARTYREICRNLLEEIGKI